MKKFLAIYIGSESGFAAAEWTSLSEKTRQTKELEGMKEWGKWVETHENSIVDMGGPLGKTKAISTRGITDTKNQMTGYTIVEAESHEKAAQYFVNHPHFNIFPGDSVEVMECLPIPGA
ncbi:MAG: hypothetical protein EOP04_14815 [Proteobacteria bacterium]|nr:MAG: hypothetical protein EOP04_14815 [Pseudomonadota bacterium]